MTEATFLASGNTMVEAVNFTAELSNKILLNQDDVAQAERIDIFCNDIGDAEKLDEVLWAKPKYSIISHSLVDKGQDDLIRIGYPGTKFNSQITHTFINGNLVYENGSINEDFRGKKISFQ